MKTMILDTREVNRKKMRNRSNQLLNIMIGLVVVLILVVGTYIIIGNNDDEEKRAFGTRRA